MNLRDFATHEEYLAYFREYRAKNKERLLLYHREYRRAYRLANRNNVITKDKCRSKLKRAVQLGTVKRLPCTYCGARKVQAHHSDYQKPLQVIWMCHLCHKKAHRFNDASPSPTVSSVTRQA